MQKEMKVCSFATAYMGFKQARELKEDVVGNLMDFREYMLENGMKIDQKDMLKELYIVGRKVQENGKNKERNEMENGKNEEKIKLKKIDHCTYEGPDNKTYILLNGGEIKEAEAGHNRESIKQQKMKNRLLGIGVVILLLLMSGDKLYGSDTNVVYNTYLPIYCANGEIVLDYATAMQIGDAREQVDYLQTVLREIKRKKPTQEELERIEKMMERYTRKIDGKRYLCVPYGTK